MHDWQALIETAMAARPAPLTATRYAGRRWQTSQAPALFHCSDGREYVCKPHDLDRGNVNECVVTTIGLAIGAPVIPFAIVDVPDTIIVNRRPDDLQDPPFPVGLAFGSLWQGKMHKLEMPTADEAHTLGRLRILFEAVGQCRDCHVFRKPDGSLISLDFEAFSLGVSRPGGSACGANGMPCAVGACRNFAGSAGILDRMTPAVIAQAVAAPPDAWLSLGDRIDLATRLHRRREEVLQWCAATVSA